MNFCPGELFLKLLARIGEWHQNLSEKTAAEGQRCFAYSTFDILLALRVDKLKTVTEETM